MASFMSHGGKQLAFIKFRYDLTDLYVSYIKQIMNVFHSLNGKNIFIR